MHIITDVFAKRNLPIGDLLSHQPHNIQLKSPKVRAFREAIEVTWGHKSRALIQQNWYLCKKKRYQRSLSVGREERPCGDRVSNYLSVNQEESSHWELNLPTQWSWNSSLQNHEKINICFLSHLASGIFYGSLGRLIQRCLMTVLKHQWLRLNYLLDHFLLHICYILVENN